MICVLGSVFPKHSPLIISLVVVLAVSNGQAGNGGVQLDTLRVYNSSNGIATYDHERSKAIAARFTSLVKVDLYGVRLFTQGYKGGRARIRVFGSEGGNSVPSVERDLISPVWVSSEKDRFDTLTISYDEPIGIHGGQFFICVDSISGLRVLTDRDSVVPECVCPTDQFVNQCLMPNDGKWATGPYTFLIEPIVGIDRSLSSIRFDTDTMEFEQSDTHGEFSILVADFNQDGELDIIAENHIILGPLTAVNAHNRSILTLSDLHSSLVGVPLLSTIRTETSPSAIVGIQPGKEVATTRWISHSIEGYTVTLPMNGKPMYSIAIRASVSEPEYLVVAERSMHELKNDITDHETYLKNDKLHIVTNISTNIQETILEIPDNHFVHSGYASDVDRDGDLDLVVACTSAEGHLFVYTSENRAGLFSDLERGRYQRTALIERPVAAAIPSVHRAVDEQRIQDDLLVITTATAREPEVNPHSLTTLDQDYDEKILIAGLQDHDRISAISVSDTDNDQYSEVIVSSSDSCRRTALYRLYEDHSWLRIFGTGIEALSGSPDLAWCDLDGDLDNDAIGIVDHRIVIAWNFTVQPQNKERREIPDRLISDVSVAEARHMDKSASIRSFYGGGRNIHVRANPSLIVDASADTILIIRRTSGGRESTVQYASISEHAIGHNDFACHVSIVPNPFHGEVTIAITNSSEPITSCRIVDAAGVEVWSAPQNEWVSACVWNGMSEAGSPVASGVYTLYLKTTSCSSISRIIKVQ